KAVLPGSRALPGSPLPGRLCLPYGPAVEQAEPARQCGPRPSLGPRTRRSISVKALRRESLLMQDMRRILLGANAALLPPFPCLRSWRLRFRRRLPDLHGPVQAGRGDPLAITAEGHGLDPARMAAQDMGLRTGPVPDLDGAVGAAPGQSPAVPAEHHALDRAGGGGQVVDPSPGPGVPAPEGA